MKIEGLNVDVLVVGIRRRKRVFHWHGRTFAGISMVAFGFGPNSPRAPILLFRKKSMTLEYRETSFCEYMGGHQDSPVIFTPTGRTGGKLVAEEFEVGDRLLIAGHSQGLTKPNVRAFRD
jgi:hypothetical protein